MDISRRTLRLTAGVIAAILCANANAADVFAIGPVEKISADNSFVTVLGQTYSIAQLKSSANHSGLSSALEGMTLGAYVYISGERASDDSLVAESVGIGNAAYVPGASQVFLSGVVSKYNQALGEATIGGTQIYLPNATVNGSSGISIGAQLEVAGYQSHPSAQIWATEIQGANRNSIQGTGKRSIQGTGILSIQGTGILSIQGTGILSIQGTGIQSIQGTGAQSAQSIQGTGIQSIQGTGVQSAQSIQGTGIQSFQGTGVQSAQSIQGTGVQSAQSIQGTGKQSIQGTGKQSIQGTGIQSTGTNVQSAQSIQGTGKLSIQGTGKLSIQGTGK
jgi:hypothetical protein